MEKPNMPESRLSPTTRERALTRLAATTKPGQELDLLVIGGGVTGAGVALDAVSRGLTVGIVESQDWGAGTSSRSSKLVHGGLRYLQMLDFKLVLEALKERDLLLRSIAPHLVRATPFLYPLRRKVTERAFVGAGILLYDLLATLGKGPRAVPFHRHLGRRRLAEVFPDLAPEAAVGAIEYWDATVDDARFVLTLLRTAVEHGAHAASRTRVVGLTKTAAGAVDGARVMDMESGETFEVKARTVVSSTGVWTEQSQDLAGDSGGLRVLASKGIHIVVDRDRIQGHAAVILKTAKSVLFVIPWSRYWVIGTTDTPWSESLTNPVATSADIDYVLAQANSILNRPLERSDVIGTWAGLRPLLQPGHRAGTHSAKVSREHTVASPLPGLVVVAGGKLTTYRIMARDTIDFVLSGSHLRTPSPTARIPLVGANGLTVAQREAHALAADFDWSAQMVDHLIHRYGAGIRDIVEIAREDAAAARPLAHAPAYLRAEIQYAFTHEGAIHLDDVLHRRTRLAYEYADGGLGALPEIVEIAQSSLGWSPSTAQHEIELCRRRAAAAAAAAAEPDDASAMRVREAAEAIVS